MSVVKSRLKSARDAISKKDYAAARDNAEKVLEFEPDNYNANVFLGLAQLELGDYASSERAYRTAIDSNPSQQLGWQGLNRFYERIEDWEKFVETSKNLMDLSTDATKCAEILQKLIQIRRIRGSRTEIVDVLTLLLPGSRYYDLLSSLPPPDATNPTSTTIYEIQEAMQNSLPIIEEIVAIIEREEEERMKKEVEKRRTRLGAPGPDQLKKDVGIEIWSCSKLPSLYNEIINHPRTSDELRRSTETKLLELKKKLLFALPKTSGEKQKLSQEVDNLINGAIILQLPDELAWTSYFDSKDVTTVEDYDYCFLRLFISLFPIHPLTGLLRGYLIYNGIPLEVDEHATSNDEDETPVSPVDDPDVGLDMMFEVQPFLTDSVIASRVLSEVYLRETDYANGIKMTESGIELTRRAEANYGKTLTRTHLGFKVVLGTCLVHLFPPRHHVRALSILDSALATSPDNVSALMGRGYIMEERKKWSDAADVFDRVVGLLPNDLNDGLRAKEEHAWCRAELGDLDYAVGMLKEVLDVMETLADFGSECARCLWRIGVCYWKMEDQRKGDSYKSWIAALKHDSMYAPAFTWLGKHYEEQASPPDSVRASKCFQKAFELDSREVYAARRLAVGFAEEREWDLVEVVARRTIEGEGGLDAGLSATMFTPMNAWAWKAVGCVELTRRRYAQAIQAFQVALRAEPDDHFSWLRLGEANAKAGRHAAALKALIHSNEMAPDSWMSLYFIGDVRRQVGQYREAIDLFKNILTDRPRELGVSVMLAQTYLDLGCSEMSGGFIARAEISFLEALRISLATIQSSPGFRGVIWKVAADALYNLSQRPTFIDDLSVRAAVVSVLESTKSVTGDRLAGLNIAPDLSIAPLPGKVVCACAILAYDLRLSVSSSEAQAMGSAWFDLGIALRSYADLQRDDARAIWETKAIEFLSSAVRNSPGNQEYWVALGDAYFISQPKSAQHAYIRALEIDSKWAPTWANLGLLYLYHSDVELANEALLRAQTLDPDYAMAWVGQALVATANGHDKDAKALLEHAVGLLTSVPYADMEFSALAFKDYRSSPSPKSHLALLPCLALMSRFLALHPASVVGLHLSSLIHETLGHLDTAQSLLSEAVSILEASYEETESSVIERHFVIAQSNLGRVRLASGDYDGALECLETVSGLLAEETDEEAKILRTHAHFGIGMAKFSQGSDGEEINAAFDDAMAIAGDDLSLSGHVSVLQAKVLWEHGGDESRDQAKNILLEQLANDPENLTVINTLAAMGILTDDESLIDAALSEILALPREQRTQMDPHKEVDYLLIKHSQGLGDINKVFSLAQHALYAEPSNAAARSTLASLKMAQGDHGHVLPILSGSSTDIETDNLELTLRSVATAKSDVEASVRQAQRAIMLAPWDTQRWVALAYIKNNVAQ